MPPVGVAIAAIGASIGAAAGAFGAGVAGLLGSTALTTGFGAVAFSAFKQIALGVALSALSRALAPKPDLGGAPASRGTKISLTFGEDQPQSMIFGTFGTSGDLLYHGSWGEVDDTENAYYVQVIELADWPARLKRVWIDGAWERLGATTHSGRGLPIPTYRKDGKNHLWIKFYDGTQTQPDQYLLDKFGDVDAGGSASASDIGDRRVIVQNSAPKGASDRIWLDSNDSARPKVWSGSAWVAPANLNRIQGVDGFYWQFIEQHKGEDRAVHVYANSSAYGPPKDTPSVHIFYDTDDNRAWVWKRGTWIFAGSTLEDDEDSGGTGKDRPWLPDMIGRGVPYVIVTSLYNPELFPNGRVELRFELESWGWYDRRKDSTSGGKGGQRASNWRTWKPTKNPIVFIENILRGINDPITGEHVWGGHGIRDLDLPKSTWFAAMNACDEDNDRYKASLEVRVDEEPAAIIEEFLKACAGEIAECGGEWLVNAGSPGASVYSFTDRDVVITEPDVFDPFPGLDSAYNEVRARYPEPNIGYDAKDATPLADADFLEADGGKRNIANIDFLAVTDSRQVKRLKKSALKEGRRFRRHAPIVLPPDARVLSPLDKITWSSERYGYDAKKFTIDMVEDYRSGCVALSLREVDPSDYDPDFEEPDEEPERSKPKKKKRAPDFSVEGTSVKGNDGTGRRAAIMLKWKVKTGIRAIRYQVRTKDDHDHIPVNADAADKKSKSFSKALVAAGKKITIGGDRARFNKITAVEDGKAVLHGGGLMPEEKYEVRAIYVPVEDREWSPWMQVTTPKIRIPQRDLDEEVQAKLDAPTRVIDSVTNIVPDDQFQTASAWGAEGEWSLNPNSSHPTAISLGELKWTWTSNAGNGWTSRHSRKFKVAAGDRLRWRIQFDRSSVGQGALVIVRLIYFTKDGTQLAQQSTLVNEAFTNASLQTRTSIVPGVPASAYQAELWLTVDRDETDSNVRFFSPSVYVSGATVVKAYDKRTGNVSLPDGGGYVDLLEATIIKQEGDPVEISTRVTDVTGAGDVTYRIRAGATTIWENAVLQAWWYENNSTFGSIVYKLQAKAEGGNAQIGERVLGIKQHI